MTSRHDWFGFRRPRNVESRDQATNHNQAWEPWQLDLLLDWNGDDDELTALAELLGRTREACRERYYHARRTAVGAVEPPRHSTTVVQSVTTATTTVYHYDRWPEDERSEWYR